MNRTVIKEAIRESYRKYFPHSMIVVYYNDGSYNIKKEWPKSIDIRIYLSGKDSKMNFLKEPEKDLLSITFAIYGVDFAIPDVSFKQLPERLNLRSSYKNRMVLTKASYASCGSGVSIKTVSTNVTGNANTIIDKLSEVFLSIRHQLLDCLNNQELHESDRKLIHDKIVPLPLHEKYVSDLSMTYLYRSSDYEVWYDENDVEYIVDLRGQVH